MNIDNNDNLRNEGRDAGGIYMDEGFTRFAYKLNYCNTIGQNLRKTVAISGHLKGIHGQLLL